MSDNNVNDKTPTANEWGRFFKQGVPRGIRLFGSLFMSLLVAGVLLFGISLSIRCVIVETVSATTTISAEQTVVIVSGIAAMTIVSLAVTITVYKYISEY